MIRSIRSAFLLFLVAASAAGLLVSCAQSNDKAAAPGHLAVISVSGSSAGKALSAARAFNANLPVAYGHIDSGPPDYLVFTLKKITLSMAAGGAAEIWSNADGVPITVSGNGAIDLTGVSDIHDLPVGTITDVKLTLATNARIKGSLSAHFTGAANAVMLYTKSALSYNAHTYLGGSATVADFETTPAEETEVWWNGPENNSAADHEFTFPVSATLAAGDAPKLTILFDISRALRFYDGQGGTNGGPSPADKTDSAYFFSHSVLKDSIVCYFGDAGSIQGYSTLYENSSAQATSVIPGWMTLIYSASGALQSGVLIGDDDNAGTVLKGHITSSSANATVGIDFSYDTSNVTVTGFQKASVVGAVTEAPWLQTASPNGGGDARFTLALNL